MTKTQTLLFITLFLLILSGCSRLSGKQKEAVSEAIQSLGKLKAATQVGVNYQQYGTLLIEAKAKVNEAVELLPDGELKKSLDNSIQGYADAHTYWGTKINSNYSVENEIKPVLVKKYKVPVESFGYMENQKEILTVVWSAAEGFRQKASQTE